MGDQLHIADYCVFSIFLFIPILVGFYHAISGGRQRSPEEFLTANRQLGVLPASLSILVSFQSAVMILGYTAEMYTRGTQLFIWGAVASLLAVLVTERFLVPLFFPLRLTSVFDYLEMRFKSKAARLTGTSIGLTAQVLYMGVAIFAPSIAMEAVSAIPVWCSCLVMASACTLYTSLGGLKTVVWTDVFQFTVMLAGLLTVMIKGIIEVGGFGNVWNISKENGRIDVFNFDPNPTTRNTFWTFIFGFFWFWLSFFGVNQSFIQRVCSTKTLRDARISVLVNMPLMVIMQTLAAVIGLVVYSYFTNIDCDPLLSKEIGNPNQLLPLFVVKILGRFPGISGLFIATLYSGALSSVSSSLSAVTANTWDDLLKPIFTKYSPTVQARVNRILVLCYGFLALTLALMASVYPGPTTQIAGSFMGAANGPLLGMFIMGAMIPMTNWKGVVTGGIAGFGLSVFVALMSKSIDQSILNPPLPPSPVTGCCQNGTSIFDKNRACNLTSFNLPIDGNARQNTTHDIHGISYIFCISYNWYSLFGSLLTILIALPISYLTGDQDVSNIPEELRIRLFGGGNKDSEEHRLVHTSRKKNSVESSVKSGGIGSSPKPEKLTSV